MTAAPRAVLLDIEGTISSIRFVYDEMFPFARREIPRYVESHFDEEDFAATIEAIAGDKQYASAAQWWESCEIEAKDRPRAVIDAAIGMMDDDRKATGLKRLQGEVWQAGFESGELKSHHYEDVRPALDAWKADGRDIRIYSSGSIQAQLLFFRYTQSGDWLHYFSGHYDTTTGPKKEAASYRRIAEDMQIAPEEILFCSDNRDELDAAREAGMRTALCVRPGNEPVPDPAGHPVVDTFNELP